MDKKPKIISEHEMRKITADAIDKAVEAWGKPESDYQKGFQHGLRFIESILRSIYTDEYVVGVFTALKETVRDK